MKETLLEIPGELGEDDGLGPTLSRFGGGCVVVNLLMHKVFESVLCLRGVEVSQNPRIPRASLYNVGLNRIVGVEFLGSYYVSCLTTSFRIYSVSKFYFLFCCLANSSALEPPCFVPTIFVWILSTTFSILFESSLNLLTRLLLMFQFKMLRKDGKKVSCHEVWPCIFVKYQIYVPEVDDL
eukprot:snap_masked-scaffold_7-processed-gene-7.21-mRNA-1 protein AED:1.00 eAED:1.00 QI:0/0/0/0/1/1/2/0/180